MNVGISQMNEACIKCRDLRCEGFEFYDYENFRFCRPQIMWAFLYWEILGDGDWVKSPDNWESIDKTRTDEAYYEKPEIIHGILDERLDKCGKTRKEWVLWDVQQAMSDKGEYQSVESIYKELHPELRDVLNYLSGWRTRERTFREWIKDREKYQVKY